MRRTISSVILILAAFLSFLISGQFDHQWHASGDWQIAQQAFAQTSAFIATFDGSPSAPQPFAQHPAYASLDVQVHSRSAQPWQVLPSMQAQHGANCSGPPAAHTTSSYDRAVYICNNHVMTAINGSEYGLIVLTPSRMLNVASGGTVSFELSTEKMSKRDWWDVMITPWSENLALPLLSDLSQGVDLQGPPRNAIMIATDNGQGAPVLKVVRNGVVQSYGSGESVPALGQGVVAGTNQASTRQSFRFTAANGRMRFERLASSTAPALVYWDIQASATFGTGVVQFAHHSYDPTKDGSGVPATWHWDSLAITNNSDAGTGFTIQHAAPRQLTSAGTVTFPAAPAGAFLRFAALCRPVINGVARTYQTTTEAHRSEHASSYFVPIPAGSTSATVGFTADDWYTPGLGCFARDFHVWALSGPGAPTPTPVSQPPAPTATSVPPQPPAATPTSIPPVACSRPTISVVRESPGVLRASITAVGTNNTIRRVDFNPVGAIVRLTNLPDQLGPFSSTPQTVSTSFRILQRTPGTSATVHLVVTHACGSHSTFVGGGPSAF
jgi:hypothetical protein